MALEVGYKQYKNRIKCLLIALQGVSPVITIRYLFISNLIKMSVVSFIHIISVFSEELKNQVLDRAESFIQESVDKKIFSSESLSVFKNIKESILKEEGLLYARFNDQYLWTTISSLLEDEFGNVDRIRRAFNLQDKKYNMPSIEYLLMFLYLEEPYAFKRVTEKALEGEITNQKIKFFKQDLEDSDFWHEIKREYDFECFGLGFDFKEGKIYLNNKPIIYYDYQNGWIIDIKKTKEKGMRDFNDSDIGKISIFLRQSYAILKLGEEKYFSLKDLTSDCKIFANGFKKVPKLKSCGAVQGSELLTTQINKLFEEIGYKVKVEDNNKYILTKKRTT